MSLLLPHVENIWQAVAPRLQGFSVEVLPTIDSTNTELMRRARAGQPEPVLLAADEQTAGRGRLGKGWHSQPGQSLTFSLGLPMAPVDWSGLSLAVGVSVAESLHPDIRLKWPNDLLHAGRKLAGILIEMRSELGGPCTVVIGVGVNIELGEEVKAAIDQPSAGLADCCEQLPSRNRVAAALLDALVEHLQGYAAGGFAKHLDAWLELDALAGRTVELVLPDRLVRGIARGVDAQGMLRIEHNGRMETFLSGHVRPVGPA